MPTVAENIVATLRANDIHRVYGLPGDSLNGFTDALRKDGTMRWEHVRHEEAAAFAASAEAALTGDLTVCAGSCGPGNLHLINGLYDANRSRVPVLAIAAHIPTAEIGSGYFQETHPQELFRECSVYVEYVADPVQMPRLLEIAMREAIEKRGVAVLVIPGDVLLAEAKDDRVTRIERTTPRIVPSEAELQRTADLLNGADRITILAGAGVADAHDEVVALAERLQAPIVHALRGKEYIEHDNPYDVGMTGLLGFASGYRAMEDADVVLMLGTDFPYQQFFPAKAKHVQVDIRGSQLGRRHPVDIGLVGTVKDTALALIPLLTGSHPTKHLEDSLKHYRKTREKLDDLAVPAGKKKPLHPQYVARVLDRLAAEDAVFIPDVGSPVVWASRYLTMNGKRRLIGSFVHGTMANAVPQAIGAQTAFPDRQVIALAGDGGLTMLLGELITIVQNKLPVKIVVFDNSSLNFVELEMKAAGFVNYGTELQNPDFAAVAEAIGIKGFQVDVSDDFEDAMAAALAHDGPALVSVRANRQELSMPPAVTLEQAKGFTLYAIRTVLSGRGDELLDLASTNARQLL
ncbi:pyruvate dehydrogenase [Curtobacterium sp. MCBA15_007]|uniref:Pyruvate dehydrogenase [ubiquinone] n=3 Tax=Bacteria TaxID=2 RepID=A0A9Q2W7D2_9MICO|nr:MULTISPECIES: ubiquinone-dependent pyruvate dehydrogenase [Curtobacterium]KIQ06206.1 pyruvate dehydrogenase [Curtobacterium flaccumfaciens]MBT1543605.1 ubiquinone-dependent pyruvate dehydrogenase [Curtobacterium flaccumfaciens pv. flaccumfaciens]MCS6563942.1 ubiquinone-dependent pyruvate dehydrogenase [Curtobacterium flaccumfaciens pv. flaccumfaciens]MCS6577515.1 ubiquinone-dependent pyruvate dehydrogenase [Curtobacterium flaccumfaciens]MCU0115891.1 ubiquinone-dependent pyruvate dehydrogena